MASKYPITRRDTPAVVILALLDRYEKDCDVMTLQAEMEQEGVAYPSIESLRTFLHRLRKRDLIRVEYSTGHIVAWYSISPDGRQLLKRWRQLIGS